MSETTKWKPAPWGNGETIEIRGQEEAGISIAFLSCDPGSPRDIQARANAHLIASAPEMYAVLERAYKKYSNWLLDDDYDANGLLHEIMETFPPVLAKARGES